MSDCPVCGKAGVEETALRCPQCHADLECFALLDALHEGAQAPAVQADLEEVKQALARLGEAVRHAGASRGRRLDWPVLTALAGLAALILALQFLALGRPPAEPPVPALDQAQAQEAVAGGIERLAARLGVIEERLDTLAAEQARTVKRASEISGAVLGIQDELARLAATAAVETEPELVLHHHLRRGESLWSIAKLYYGRGLLYPVLIAQNPGLGPYHLGTGVLRILGDPKEAEELYRRITPPGAEGRLFRYRVEPGDDWSKLAGRFLGRPSRAAELVALNPGSDLTPGEQVLIALE